MMLRQDPRSCTQMLRDISMLGKLWSAHKAGNFVARCIVKILVVLKPRLYSSHFVDVDLLPPEEQHAQFIAWKWRLMGWWKSGKKKLSTGTSSTDCFWLENMSQTLNAAVKHHLVYIYNSQYTSLPTRNWPIHSENQSVTSHVNLHISSMSVAKDSLFVKLLKLEVSKMCIYKHTSTYIYIYLRYHI